MAPTSSRRAAADPLSGVIAFLSDPGSYPGRPAAVQRVETHTSHVFLAGDLVYKMKKPIRLDLLDFRRLESRRLNCERELALNQRLAPGIYLAVVPLVRRREGGLSIGGDGAVVEWLLVMRRLGPERLMSRLAETGALRPRDVERLCALIAGFYRDAPRPPLTARAHLAWWRGQLALLERSLLDPLFAIPTGLHRPPLEALRHFLRADFALLATRAEERRIVEAHGDLRPEHVHFGPPLRLVDRLEFNARLRWLDPFDEISLLGVECARLGAAWVGPALCEGVARRLKDRPDPRLLGFYRIYRACLRARLSIEHLRDPRPRTPERWPRQAAAYLELAAGLADQS